MKKRIQLVVFITALITVFVINALFKVGLPPLLLLSQVLIVVFVFDMIFEAIYQFFTWIRPGK